MISVDRDGEVFVLTMDEGENRWNTTFVRAFDEALNEIGASEGPAAMVTRSTNEKFFSNGLDLEWIMGSDENHPGGDRALLPLDELGVAHDAGVGDQHVDSAQLLRDLVGGGIDLRRIHHVQPRDV